MTANRSVLSTHSADEAAAPPEPCDGPNDEDPLPVSALEVVRPLILRIRKLERRPMPSDSVPVIEALPLDSFFVIGCPPWKRAMDIIGALVGIVVGAPLMLFIAVIIKITSPGPVIFKQRRGGLGGKAFTVYKFRTMVEDAEARKAHLRHLNERTGAAFKIKNDPRITRVGRFLRNLSMDELPQFFNVLMGDMSLVGPRPLPVTEENEYAVWQRARLAVRPGLTCIWQVSSRNRSCFDHWVRLDLQYIRSMSFWLDVKILLLTFPAVLSRRGAH